MALQDFNLHVVSGMKMQNKYDALASKEDIILLETKIEEAKVEQLKWIFSIFTTLALMIVGLYFKK